MRKFSISCTDADWTSIKLAAEQAGAASAARFMVERALSADLPRSGEEVSEPLVLDGDAQRALLDKVTMIEASFRSGPVPEELLKQVQRRTAFLLRAFVAELVQAGREDVILATAEEVLGEDAVPSVRAWIERGRQNDGAHQS